VKRLLVAGAALAATVSVVPAGHATAPDVVHGVACGYETSYDKPELPGDTWTGVQFDSSATTTGDAVPQPIGATITCWLEVDGVTAPGTTYSYGDVPGVTGVQAGAHPISFRADKLATVAGCETDAFADGTSTSICWIWGDDIQIPPQAVQDIIDKITHGGSFSAGV
jgi:hypothetical protein